MSLSKFKSIVLVLCLPFLASSQSFEGVITFKLEMFNPNPEMIPDSLWDATIKAQFGEEGFMTQKYFYKGKNYTSEITAAQSFGHQTYNVKDGLLYSWQENSDTAITLDSKKYIDKVESFTKLPEKEMVMGIECQKIKMKTSLGSMTIWYNPEYMKMNPKLYKGHVYGHWEAILKETGCLPLKIEQKGFMTHFSQTVIDFKETEVDDSKFEIPEFKEVIANPVN